MLKNRWLAWSEPSSLEVERGFLPWEEAPSYLQGVVPAGQFAFAIQERLKGRMDSTVFNYLVSSFSFDWGGIYNHNYRELKSEFIAGSDYGGWGFNLVDHPDKSDKNNPVSPTQTYLIEDSTLKIHTFFRLGIPFANVLGDGAVTLSDDLYDQLLSEAIPALSLPAGGPGGGVLEEKGVFPLLNVKNMQTSFKTGWPKERDNDRWVHSDLKTIAYTYIYKLFNQLTGTLR